MLQVNDNFAITQICDEEQQLAYIGLSTEEEALEGWKAYRQRFSTWELVKDTTKVYYGYHYNPNRAFVIECYYWIHTCISYTQSPALSFITSCS